MQKYANVGGKIHNMEIISEDSISTQWKLCKDGMELVEMIIK